MSRGGRISQKHYAEKLGCKKTVLKRRAELVLIEYQGKLGDLLSNNDRHLPAMRIWLEEMLANSQLEVRGKRVSRRQVAKHFNVPAIELNRCVNVRALMHEFDAKVSSGYLPELIQSKIDMVREILASKACPIEPQRSAVSHNRLAQLADVHLAALARAPFSELVARKDDEIRQALEASRIDPFFGRVYQFSDLVPQFSLVFLEKVACAFREIYESKSQSSAIDGYKVLKLSLKWIAAGENEWCRAVLNSINAGEVPNQADWSGALESYSAQRISVASSTGLSTTNDAIRTLSRLAEGFARLGVTPALVDPLAGIRYAKRKRARRKSVAEAGFASIGVKDEAAKPYTEFAREILHQAGAGYDVKVEGAEDFLAGITSEIADFKASNSPNLAETILQVINRRLDAIHSHAASLVERWAAHYARGRALRQCATIDPQTYYSVYCSSDVPVAVRRAWLNDNFSVGSGAENKETERALGNLLSIIDAHYDGVVPGDRNTRAREESGTFFNRRYREHGGIDFVDAYSTPHSDAYCAALTLYLCESGANLAVGRALLADCLQPSDLPGYIRVTGHKARAQGKPIYVELGTNSSAARALTWIRDAGATVRFLATDGKRDLLFVRREGERRELFSPYVFADWFKKFCAGIPELSGIQLLPSMLRPSVLLKVALENNGRIQAGMAIGQHTESVSQGYQNKWPTRLLYDVQIRKFQTTLESVIVQNISSAAARLGISAEEFGARIEALQKTGFGTFCMDRLGNPRSQGTQCTTVDCWNDCPQMVFVAEVEAVATLQIWQRALRDAQPIWERDRPERWDKVWLPWLCLIDVIEEKMARGPLLRVWELAAARRAGVELSPNFVPPRPW